ncbi:hypothetical protein [Paraburkholderia graminis]|uniref:hypothetical protein n=1 Tax=Paraburkholderia graminis TaxID=60548 RepID=UPI0004A7C4A6
MSKFDEFSNEWLTAVEVFSLKGFKDFKQAAISDARDFFTSSQEDLRRWADKFGAGELNRKELRSLIRGERELLEMHALHQAGVVKVRTDMFVNGILDLTVNTITKVFLV